MSTPRARALRLALLMGWAASAVALPACDEGDDGASSSSSASSSSGGPACLLGETRCDGSLVQSCEDSPTGTGWSASAHCPGDQSCHDDACADPTSEQLSRVATLEKYVDDTVDHTGLETPLDATAIKAAGRELILQGDRSEATFFLAMHRAHLAMPQGHQALVLKGNCNTPDLFQSNWSRLGACGRPAGDDIIVTSVAPGNPLGLSPGDRVIRAGADVGAAMFDAADGRPSCGDVAPSASGRRTFAAATFFGTVPDGMELEIQPADGSAARVVTVPAGAMDFLDCQDPLGQDIDFNAKAYVRPDGVAVIRLPRFYPNDATLPPNPTQEDYDAFIDHMRQAVVVEFEKVKDAPSLVWDARGNYGGITLIGLEIAGGMPTAKPTAISHCNARVAKSSPPSFSTQDYAVYDVTPGGPFVYAGKVAIVIDGLDYSAADYFPLAVHKATSTPIFGSGAAGAFGGPGPVKDLTGPPAMLYDVDSNHCVDAATGAALEGKGQEPDFLVEYAPADLASGVDTVLEAAVAAVK